MAGPQAPRRPAESVSILQEVHLRDTSPRRSHEPACGRAHALRPNLVREPDAGKPHVRFDERGWETESLVATGAPAQGESRRKQLPLRPTVTAPILDSTDSSCGVSARGKRGRSRADSRNETRGHREDHRRLGGTRKPLAAYTTAATRGACFGVGRWVVRPLESRRSEDVFGPRIIENSII